MGLIFIKVNFWLLRQLLYFFSIIFFWTHHAFGQSIQLSIQSELEEEVIETSGLLWIDNRLVTHNDSGDDPILYEIDPATGEVTRKVTIANAANKDWEDICADETHIYIGDIGNNTGSRKDLVIYKIALAEFLNTANDTLLGEKIQYQYAEQVDFQPTQFQTNYDAEALISFQDSLYLFTKNWGNLRSNIYTLPKEPGEYMILKKDSLFIDGLITAGVVNSISNTLVLCGYSSNIPFVVEINDLDSGAFPIGYFQKYMLSVDGSTQIEGITFQDANQYLLSAEGNFFGPAVLYSLQFPITAVDNQNDYSITIFPNPVNEVLNVSANDAIMVEIYSSNGMKKVFSNSPEVKVDDLTKGMYTVIVKDLHQNILAVEKIVKL